MVLALRISSGRCYFKRHIILYIRVIYTIFFTASELPREWDSVDKTRLVLTAPRAHKRLHVFPDMSRPYSSPGYGPRAGEGYSSRATYPTFLTPQETALHQLKAAGRGLFDAFRWDAVIRLVSRCVCYVHQRLRTADEAIWYSDAEVRSNVLKSLLLNVVSLSSVYFFDLLLQPLTHEHTHWLRRNVGWFYQILWLLPVVGISLYLNVRRCRLCVHFTY